MPGGAAVSSNRAGDATEHTTGPSNAATASEHSEPQREAPSPERRVDQDGVAYTYGQSLLTYEGMHTHTHTWQSIAQQSKALHTCIAKHNTVFMDYVCTTEIRNDPLKAWMDKNALMRWMGETHLKGWPVAILAQIFVCRAASVGSTSPD